MNLSLKKALIDRRVPAYRTAQECGINPVQVSKFISGLAHPTETEKSKLAEILEKPIDEIFPVLEII